MHSSSTGIPHARKMDAHLPRSYLVIQCKTVFPLIGVPLHKSGRSRSKKLKQLPPKHNKQRKPPITSILAVYLTSKLATTSQYKMLPPRCGTFMEPLQPLVLIGDILSRRKMEVFLLETDDSSARESHYPSLAHNLHHPFQSHTQHPSQTLVGHLVSHSDPRTLSSPSSSVDVT